MALAGGSEKGGEAEDMVTSIAVSTADWEELATPGPSGWELTDLHLCPFRRGESMELERIVSTALLSFVQTHLPEADLRYKLGSQRAEQGWVEHWAVLWALAKGGPGWGALVPPPQVKG